MAEASDPVESQPSTPLDCIAPGVLLIWFCTVLFFVVWEEPVRFGRVNTVTGEYQRQFVLLSF